jgi:hypothetical protein
MIHFVVVSFVVVADVAVVAVAVIAVMWGGIARFACGDGVLLGGGVGGGRDLEPPTGLRMLKGPLAVLQLMGEL